MMRLQSVCEENANSVVDESTLISVAKKVMRDRLGVATEPAVSLVCDVCGE
jgi:hypothetical protein